MNIVMKARGKGKTEALIDYAAKHGYYIVVRDGSAVREVAARASTKKLRIPFPLTYNEVINGHFNTRGVKGLCIDDADEFLQRVCKGTLAGFSLTEESPEDKARTVGLVAHAPQEGYYAWSGSDIVHVPFDALVPSDASVRFLVAILPGRGAVPIEELPPVTEGERDWLVKEDSKGDLPPELYTARKTLLLSDQEFLARLAMAYRSQHRTKQEEIQKLPHEVEKSVAKMKEVIHVGETPIGGSSLWQEEDDSNIYIGTDRLIKIPRSAAKSLRQGLEEITRTLLREGRPRV